MPGARDYSEAEIETVRKSFSGRYKLRDRCYFELALATGLRVSEVISIRVGQVHVNGKVPESLSIARANMKGGKIQKVKPKPAGHADTCHCEPCELASGVLKPRGPVSDGRTVPLAKNVHPHIIVWLTRLAEMLGCPSLYDLPAMTPLYCSRVRCKDGTRRAISRETAWRITKGIALENDFKRGISCHSTRKTLARRAEQLFKDPRKVQKILGHKSLASTEHYLQSIHEQELWNELLVSIDSKAA
jgi:site-specific recombinase XerD